jgi:HME family heavy-metal exporter
VPEVKSVGRRTGRAELDEHAEGVHSSELDIDLHRSERPKEAVYADIRAALGVLPVSVNIGQPIGHRLDHMLSGVRAQIALKGLRRGPRHHPHLAESLRERLGRAGLVDLQVEKQVRIPQLRIDVDYEKAALYGPHAGDGDAGLETLSNGPHGLADRRGQPALRRGDAPVRPGPLDDGPGGPSHRHALRTRARCA